MIEKKETMMVGGYECYVKDGEYCTLIDGQECVVLTDLIEVTDEETLAYLNSTLDNENYLRSSSELPSDVYDLRNEQEFHDDVNVTSSDYMSQKLAVDLSANPIRLHIGFWNKRTVKLSFYYYIPALPNTYDTSKAGGSWFHADVTAEFWLGSQTKKYAVDTAFKTATILQMKVFNEGTEPQKEFDYYLSVSKKD